MQMILQNGLKLFKNICTISCRNVAPTNSGSPISYATDNVVYCMPVNISTTSPLLPEIKSYYTHDPCVPLQGPLGDSTGTELIPVETRYSVPELPALSTFHPCPTPPHSLPSESYPDLAHPTRCLPKIHPPLYSLLCGAPVWGESNVTG